MTTAPAISDTVCSRQAALQERAYWLPEHWIWQRDDRHWHESLSAYLSGLIREGLPQGRILDVGCGDGKGTNDVQRHLGAAYTIEGCDYSARAIAFARLMAPHISFTVSALGDATLGRESYDAVVFREVIEHLPPGEEEPALRQLFEYLKPGGLLVLTTPHEAIPVSDKHFRHYTAESLTGVVCSAGFEDLDIFGFGRVPPRLLLRIYGWMVCSLPVVWRICRRMNVVTRPTRCRTLVCVARRPEAAGGE